MKVSCYNQAFFLSKIISLRHIVRNHKQIRVLSMLFLSFISTRYHIVLVEDALKLIHIYSHPISFSREKHLTFSNVFHQVVLYVVSLNSAQLLYLETMKVAAAVQQRKEWEQNLLDTLYFKKISKTVIVFHKYSNFFKLQNHKIIHKS